MAKAKGARVFGTCSPRNNDFVSGLGVEECIDYRSEDFVQAVMRFTDEKGADAVFDTVGGETLSRSLGALKPYGRIASITNTTGNLGAAYTKNIIVNFQFLERSGKKMEELHDLVENGAVRPLIDSVMPLEQVGEAQTRLEKGGVRGKIVLSVG
jgi:NADPH:quinone reductase-like Zn-dependent oxidoreductase